MNVLFLTMVKVDVNKSGIYDDLMRKFKNEGHEVFIVSPSERREKGNTGILTEDNVHTLSVRTLNVQKANIIEKGIGQVSMAFLYKRAIRKYLAGIKFDLILYSTPPITLVGVVEWMKRKNPDAVSYLLLKDIFPQNAVDIGLLSKSGLKGLLYKFFRMQEERLYKVSDYIGCMSPANVQYILKHNTRLTPEKVEVAPNSYELCPGNDISVKAKNAIRSRYGLPLDRPVLIYGGNFGKPQGMPFIIECMNAVKDRDDCHFVLVGDGTEYAGLESWYKSAKPSSVSVLKKLPKEDYDILADTCDVGLIFLDYRFTVPNYPSRLLAYLMAGKPIIACTDPNCDTGAIAESNGYGFYCPSNDVSAFVSTVDRILASDMDKMGESGRRFFADNYTVDNTYDIIMSHRRKCN